MVEFSRAKRIKKPVKRHLCWLCEKPIEIGEEHYYTAGHHEHGFWANRHHLGCAKGNYAWIAKLADGE